jgi:glycosyltransferase involved in cell wall biosynthesis
VRIAVVHNLPSGGAHRRLAGQLKHLQGEITEICLQTATPITRDARIVALRPYAPRLPRLLRPPLRYLDLLALERAWRQAAREIRDVHPDVVYLNPCRYLNGPPVLGPDLPRVVYFCDEPRRIDAEPALRSTRSSLTYALYAPLYARERRDDRDTAARAWSLATNSNYTASQIGRVYGRSATVVKMGVANTLIEAASATRRTRGDFLLSVGALVATKGHDLALRAAANSRSRLPLRVIAPRPDPPEEQRLRALARRLGVELSIEVGISDRELASRYTTAFATLYLAEREPLGLVSLEAQACGCPVIVAAEGGLPETIVDGVTGWQVPRDPSAAASAVDRLQEHEVWQRASEAAQAHAREWTWQASAAEIQALLDAACESKVGA